MEFPLDERIGDPWLLVGREKEFAEFGKWIDGIPRRISKSRVIVARKESGKTAFIQRLFNRLWSDRGPVIPFLIEIPELKTTFPDLAEAYFTTFASQYISFLEREPDLVRNHLEIDQIREYAVAEDLDMLARQADAIAGARD